MRWASTAGKVSYRDALRWVFKLSKTTRITGMPIGLVHQALLMGVMVRAGATASLPFQVRNRLSARNCMGSAPATVETDHRAGS